MPSMPLLSEAELVADGLRDMVVDRTDGAVKRSAMGASIIMLYTFWLSGVGTGRGGGTKLSGGGKLLVIGLGRWVRAGVVGWLPCSGVYLRTRLRLLDMMAVVAR